jgi:hypothetical protein
MSYIINLLFMSNAKQSYSWVKPKIFQIYSMIDDLLYHNKTAVLNISVRFKHWEFVAEWLLDKFLDSEINKN